MKVERCNQCGKIRKIIFKYGEQPAQLIPKKDKCECSNRFENEK